MCIYRGKSAFTGLMLLFNDLEIIYNINVQNSSNSPIMFLDPAKIISFTSFTDVGDLSFCSFGIISPGSIKLVVKDNRGFCEIIS